MCYSATILIAVAARGCLCATTPAILCKDASSASRNITVEAKSRLSPTSLAKKVARAGKRTSQSLADDLANEFSLPSTERRANQNLDTMEQLCHTTEMGPSDEEFV